MEMNNTQMVYGLYGSYIKRTKACAYCYYHKCHLTVATMKKHECLKKQCECLKKHEENDYWRQRNQIKMMKKARKVN